MTALTFIEPQFIKTGQDQRTDLDQYIVCGVHLAEGSSAGVARAWVVNPDNTDGGEVEIPSDGGKVDSVSCKVLRDGSVRFVVSQAIAPGASGSTATPFAYVVPDVFPPQSSSAAGGSAYVTAPGGELTALQVAPFTGSTWIDLDVLGVPPDVTLLNLQVQIVAPQVGRRVLAGVAGSNTWQLVAMAQAANVEVTTCGLVTPNASHNITVTADVGDLARLEVYILGWWEA